VGIAVSEELEQVLSQLRREYLAESPARLAELRRLIAAFRAGDPDASQSLIILFHRLAGSGGSYGFPEISEIGRTMERWLKSTPPPGPEQAGKLEEAVEQLARNFDQSGTQGGEGFV
jgi:HPt (histidine-containing phosphotransfer) domain-containing protein